MKKFLIFLALTLISGSLVAGHIVRNRDQFQDYVRQITGLEGTPLMPDSTLNAIIQHAVLRTSVEAGGVETQYRLVMASGTAWYNLPDSVTEILFATLLTEDGRTFSVKAFFPQWFGDTESPPKLSDDATPDEYPFGYNYWADTLQVFPIPNRADTLIVKCYVEHPTFQGTDSTNDTLQFKPVYTDAAIELAASMALEAVESFDKADRRFAKWEKMRDALRAIYRRKFDIASGGQ